MVQAQMIRFTVFKWIIWFIRTTWVGTTHTWTPVQMPTISGDKLQQSAVEQQWQLEAVLSIVPTCI